jgi:hypothetical protein
MIAGTINKQDTKHYLNIIGYDDYIEDMNLRVQGYISMNKVKMNGRRGE